uniref:Uncharacterized protein n=1 Tax=Sus scrofa TaxID=9823 RepID=A0A4X1ULM9_PIG
MAIIKKSTNSKCWRGCGEKRTLLHCWWDCKLVQPLTVWRYLRNLYIELPYDPAIPLLGLLWFYINLWIVCSSSAKNVMGNLIRIALNL